MHPTKFLTAALFAILCAAAPARAAPITATYLFSASNFVQILPPFPPVAVPVSPVTGSFTVTFDPLAPALQSTTLVQNSINIATSMTLGYNHTVIGDILTIGRFAGFNFVLTVPPSTNDFLLTFGLASTNPTLPTFTYAQAGTPVYTALHVTVTRIAEPTALALFGAGLAGLGLARRRRKANRA